jgi:hypothetical protein
VRYSRDVDPANPVIKTESFDRDPGWEAHRNRIVPKEVPTIDRVGMFTSTIGGQVVKIFVDDLKYTAARDAR